LKTNRIAIAACFAFVAATTALPRIPAPDAALTDNPIYKEKCAKCHGKTA